MPRTAIVTGSARGIGKAIALRLAADGYDICINDIEANKGEAEEVAKEVKSLGRNSTVVVADVSKRSEVERLVSTSVSTLGPLHTMVANAGIVQVKPFIETTEEDMERMFSINVYGLNNCYLVAAKQMMSQGPIAKLNESSGIDEKEAQSVYKIIGAASIVAFKSFGLLGPYSGSKWAVRGMNQGYAIELAPSGITCNTYAPGIVGTAMWEKIDDELIRLRGEANVQKGDMFKKYGKDLIALGRTSVPEDVSNTVHFLASKDSDYMTGQCIVIDGGIVFT